MPAITFLNNPTPEQIEQIILLYRAEGWWTQGPFDPEYVARIITGSHCFIIATVGEEIVGMGRAVSDRISDAYLQDVTVKKEYRGRKIGKRMVQSLLSRLDDDGITWVGLIAERGSHEFYRRLGFNRMEASVPMLKITP